MTNFDGDLDALLDDLVLQARKAWPELGWRHSGGTIFADRGGRWTTDHVARLHLGYDAELNVVWSSPKTLGPGWTCTFERSWPNEQQLRLGWTAALREVRPLWCKAHMRDWAP